MAPTQEIKVQSIREIGDQVAVLMVGEISWQELVISAGKKNISLGELNEAVAYLRSLQIQPKHQLKSFKVIKTRKTQTKTSYVLTPAGLHMFFDARFTAPARKPRAPKVKTQLQIAFETAKA